MYMNRKPHKIIVTAASLLLTAACNTTSSDDDSYNDATDGGTSTVITAFSLKPNSKVLPNLDSVFFSIDLQRARIFNADSLPSGTDVRRLVVSISAPANAKSVEIIMPSLHDGKDTIIDYTNHPGDSINFSHGSVGLRVYAGDSDTQRYYTVKVNVHKMNPDSLQWSAETMHLPGSPSSPRSHGAVRFGGQYYSLTQKADGTMAMAVTATPLNPASWSAVVSTQPMPSDADPTTLRATTDAMYILAGGTLWRTEDGGNWSAVDIPTAWTWLYGAYGEDIIGVCNGQWLAYPSGSTGEIPSDMPVTATSPLWSYTADWFITPQALMVGGIDASGRKTGAAWGFDGNGWMQLNGQRQLPQAQGYTLFPYFAFLTDPDTYYMTDKQSAWIALGGIKADGSAQNGVYMSLDNGVNWRLAPEAMQLPEEMIVGANACAMLYDRAVSARAVAPITQWDTPYVIITAGRSTTGVQFNRMWAGVINRLSFKPLQ